MDFVELWREALGILSEVIGLENGASLQVLNYKTTMQDFL